MSKKGTDLLLCAATMPELSAFWPDVSEARLGAFALQGLQCYSMLTGVSAPAVYASLPAVLQEVQPKLVLNIGIAGAYESTGLQIGDLAVAESEVFGDIGMELPDTPGFLPLMNTPFGSAACSEFVMKSKCCWSALPAGGYLPALRGCTVNSCTGTEMTGRMRRELFQAHFETMEGAAVAHAASWFAVEVCEVRAMSNIAAKRDMQSANIAWALKNLRLFLCDTPVTR